MKKEFAAAVIALSVSMVVSVPAFAETNVRASIDNSGLLKVNIDSDKQDDTLYTAYLSNNETELKDTKGENDVLGLHILEQFSLNKSEENKFGHAALTVDISKLPRGNIYKLTLGGGELDGKTVSLVLPADNTDSVKKLKSAEASEISKILREGQNVDWTLDLDNEQFRLYETKVCENIKNLIAESPDSSVNDWFDRACALSELNKCTKSEVFDLVSKYDPLFKTDFSNTLKNDRESIAEAYINLCSDALLNPIRNVSEYSKIIHTAEALGTLNVSERKNILDVLKKYNDVFELDLDGSLKNVDSYAVVKAMKPENDAIYKSVKSVKDKFDATIKELEQKGGIKDGGTNGGGSSGGSSSGGGGSIGSAVTPEIVESVDTTPKFSDISEAEWARPFIVYLQDREILSGDGDGRVRPNDNISREEFLKILISSFKISGDEESIKDEFLDVDKNEWYAEYIDKALSAGIVKGISTTKFGIGYKLTRQDCAVMICRALDSLKQVLNMTANKKGFTDEADIADYATDAASLLQRAGVISGYENGEFFPNNPITRAETAKMIYSVLKNLGKI